VPSVARAQDLLTDGMHLCPAHADRTPSLRVTRSETGIWLVRCFAGCPTEAVLTAAGLAWPDLFAAPRPAIPAARPLSELDQARRDILGEARRQQRRWEPLRDTLTVTEAIRRCYRSVDAARREALILGDSPAAWRLLASAAALETHAQALEVGLDGE